MTETKDGRGIADGDGIAESELRTAEFVFALTRLGVPQDEPGARFVAIAFRGYRYRQGLAPYPATDDGNEQLEATAQRAAAMLPESWREPFLFGVRGQR